MEIGVRFPIFLSTLSLRRATRLEFCDTAPHIYFYPRSPCGERQHVYMLVLWVLRFLSTLSLRRATFRCISQRITSRDFYPRSPCGERHADCNYRSGHRYFYPRSPCGERPRKTYQQGEKQAFLSTLSLRRATTKSGRGANSNGISIHALLAESDANKISTIRITREDFYPRSPCGERLQWEGMKSLSEVISIHALLAESDRKSDDKC